MRQPIICVHTCLGTCVLLSRILLKYRVHKLRVAYVYVATYMSVTHRNVNFVMLRNVTVHAQMS